MKLTELWTPDECREAMRLMGEICFTEHLWHHRFAVNDSGEVCMFTRCASTDGPETWTVIEGVYATATVQVAAEQVVQPTPHYPIPFCGGRWLVCATDCENGGEQSDELYPTYLKALMGGLKKAIGKENSRV